MIVKRKYIILIVLILLVGVFTTTLAYFGVDLFGNANTTSVQTGTVELDISDSALNVSDLEPIYDKYYKTLAYKKTFTLTNSSTTLNECASIYLDISSISNTLKTAHFKYRIESSDEETILIGNFQNANTSNDFYLLKGFFMQKSQSTEFNLYIWISYDSGLTQNDLLDTSLQAKVVGIGTDSKTRGACYESIAEQDNDLDLISLYVNNEAVSQLDASKTYNLDNYVCQNDEIVTYNSANRSITVLPLDQSTRCSLYFSVSDKWYDNCTDKNNLNCKMINANTAISDAGLSFSTPSSLSGDLGLYYTYDTSRTEDIDGDGTGEKVYFYRGAVTNNYVVFAGYCWRIVRTNESGSVRLRFGGTPTINGDNYSCPQTGTDVYALSGAEYNLSEADNRYVGYMYGNTCTSYETCHANDVNSNMKNTLEGWYETNLLSYSNLITDEIFCSDRTIAVGNKYMGVINTKLGYGSNTYYGTVGRLIATGDGPSGGLVGGKPTYKCGRDSDKFSVSSNIGNGKNRFPIGLLTGDEVSYAGGEYANSDTSSYNTSYYLYTGTWYWLMSPSHWYHNDPEGWNDGCLLSFGPHGELSQVTVLYTTGSRVLPVISLIPGAIVSSGNGAYNTPYIISN